MERIGDVLPGVLRGLGLAEALAGWRSVSEWPGAVGEPIARRTRAVAFHEGVLTVEVEGAAWRHELSVLKRDLIRRINLRLGGAVVRDLRFTHNRGGIQR